MARRKKQRKIKAKGNSHATGEENFACITSLLKPPQIFVLMPSKRNHDHIYGTDQQ